MDSRKISVSPPTILTISRDIPLQQTRTAILEREGYAVIPLGLDDEVHSFLDYSTHEEIRLALMCHSVPEPSRITLCDAIKVRYPQTPILMLYNGYDPTVANVDGRLENMHSPEAFVNTIRVLVGGTKDLA
jgi:DNA-binding response OmpR family regulator